MQTLVLIHGANGAAPEMRPLVKLLAPHYDVRTPNLLGHGGGPVPAALTIEALEDDLLAWLDAERIDRAFFLGYSLGGYVALRLARHRPSRVLGVAAIALKTVFDEAAVAHIAYLADPVRLSRPGNPRKGELERCHGADKWIAVVDAVRGLFESFRGAPPLTDDDLRSIAVPVLILSGDRDPVVPIAETRQHAQLLPNARLGIFPGQAHPLRVLPLLAIVRALRTFTADVSAGAFSPGATLDLGSTLVTGGLPQPKILVAISKDRLKR